MSGFTIERIYPHPQERVWKALTDPELLGRWLMPNDFQPVIGHEFTFRTDPGPGFDGIVHCTVNRMEEPTLLAFTWKGGPIDTVVTLQLSTHESGGTRLVMSQTGFRGAKAWLIGRMLKIGCGTMYGKRLPALLDEMAGIRRSRHDGPACMKPSQRLLVRIIALFERKHG